MLYIYHHNIVHVRVRFIQVSELMSLRQYAVQRPTCVFVKQMLIVVKRFEIVNMN
jgi:hypothetical protein